MTNLNEMKVAELKEIAKELHISNWWNLKKSVLIEKIEEAQNISEEEKIAAADQKAKEDEALAIYKKHWRKYTKTFNPIEFIQKFRSGEIILEIEAGAISVETPENTLIETAPPKEILAYIENDKKTLEEVIAPTPKRGALIEWNGKSQNICAWAEELGISANTLYGRLYKLGWSVEKAFTKKK